MTYLKYALSIAGIILISINIEIKANPDMIMGKTFEERAEALIDHMTHLNTIGGDLKYTAAYHFARIYKNHQPQAAIDSLEKMLDYQLEEPERYWNSGSNIEFYAHATLHGYLLTKERIPLQLRKKVKKFLELGDYNSKGITLNLDMMRYVCGFLAAEEWSDFTDRNGKNREEIISYNRPRILKTLNNFIRNNCLEMDAFIYLPTNMMYVRMLAEYAQDKEIQEKAAFAYQQMIAAMTGAWNEEGLYIACPPRCKGWKQLVNGPYGPNSRITALAWLFFGSKQEGMEITGNYLSDHNNYSTFCFWMAYSRNIFPLAETLQSGSGKTYPYEYKSFIDHITVNREGEDQKQWKYYKYTWQSDNYGLATQTEIPYRFENPEYTYAYKEIKRTYLTWKSSVGECFFTICQDNPARPRDTINANIPAYGENPYHRVMQYKQTAIGIFNVPEDYINGKRYQLYVPFTQKGIQLRKEVQGWIFCHTGSMMFAFKTIEPYTWEKERFDIPGCDILMLSDSQCRKGSWILETTEITNQYKSKSKEEELEKYINDILSNTHIETINYTDIHPELSYKALSGNTLHITFFRPDETYNGQYRLNGTILPLTDEYLYSSPYATQKNKAEEFHIYVNNNKITVNENTIRNRQD